MDHDGLPNARPIAFSDSPRCQRSQSSVFSAAVNPRKYPCRIAIHSIFPRQDRVLRRPVETTIKKGRKPALATGEGGYQRHALEQFTKASTEAPAAAAPDV